MVKVEYLTKAELEEIGETYANYNYPENDKGMFPFDDKELLKKYIMGFAKFCMECGMLYTTSENHEGYIAYSAPDTKHPMKAIRTFFRDVVGALGWKKFLTFTKFCQSGGKSIEAQMKERKEKFVMVELLVVNEKYQGKGYMRPLMEFAIETADRYKLPLIIDSRGIIYIVLELIHMRKSKSYIPNNYLEEMINDFLTCGINRYITKN